MSPDILLEQWLVKSQFHVHQETLANDAEAEILRLTLAVAIDLFLDKSSV